MKASLSVSLALCLAAASWPAPAQPAPGADIFKARCAVCHGNDGTGNTPAGKLFKAASLKDPMVTTKSNEELFAVIKAGRNKMPRFRDVLTDPQIEAVIAYVRRIPD